MNPIDDDTLQAYVDGELDAAAAARIDAELAHDPLLAERVRRARAVRAQLQALFDPVLDEPVPTRLSALLASNASEPAPPFKAPPRESAPHAAARRTRRRRWIPAMALAASLVLVAWAVWWWRSEEQLTRVQNGQTYAAGVLANTLDRALASEPQAHAPVAIGLSFRGADGHICRSFFVRTPPARAGLACHDAAGWALPVFAPAAPPEEGELRQAASALPPQVQAAVDARLRGDAFDAQQERAARAAGWR